MRGAGGLRLDSLVLASGTRLALSADREGQIILDAEARGSKAVVSVIGGEISGAVGKLSVRAKDLVLCGAGRSSSPAMLSMPGTRAGPSWTPRGEWSG
jgi:hypothetical protein